MKNSNELKQNILFSHSYRLSLLSNDFADTIIAAFYANSLVEDKCVANKKIETDVQNRILDIKIFCSDHNVDAIILCSAQDGECTLEAKQLHPMSREGINVIGLEHSICRLFQNKADTKRFLRANMVPTINDVSSTCSEDQIIVAKPLDKWAGEGIQILFGKKELQEHIRNSVPNALLYEDFCEGYEISFQLMSDKRKMIISPPVYKGFTSTELIHPLQKLRIFPCPVSKNISQQIVHIAQVILDELSPQGIIEVEGIVTDGVLSVTEVNGRMSGTTRMIALGGTNAMDFLHHLAKRKPYSMPLSKECVVSEIPIRNDTSDALFQKLSAMPSVRYLYRRSDRGPSRKRILVRVKDYKQLKALIIDSELSCYILPSVKEDIIFSMLNALGDVDYEFAKLPICRT